MSSVTKIDFQQWPRTKPRDDDEGVGFDGGDGDNGNMESRVAKLEADVGHIQRELAEVKADLKEVRRDIAAIRTTDFRLLFGAIIAVALGLAGLMAKGFGWLS